MLDQLSIITDDVCLCNRLIIHGYAQAFRQIVLGGMQEMMSKYSLKVKSSYSGCITQVYYYFQDTKVDNHFSAWEGPEQQLRPHSIPPRRWIKAGMIQCSPNNEPLHPCLHSPLWIISLPQQLFFFSTKKEGYFEQRETVVSIITYFAHGRNRSQNHTEGSPKSTIILSTKMWGVIVS